MNDTFFIETNGQKVKCKIHFAFNKNNINYIVYTDYVDEFLASRYKIENNNIVIKPIETEEEWNIIDKEISERYG